MSTNSTILRKIVLLPLFSVALYAGSSKLSPDLAKVPPAAKVDVIIQWSTHPNSTQHNQVIELGGVLKHCFATMNAAVYMVPVNALEALAQNPDIIYISLDRTGIANVTWGGYLEMLANATWGARIVWPESALEFLNAVRANNTNVGSNAAYSALSASIQREH